LITSAGVTKEAAGIPAMAPAVNKDKGELYPFSSKLKFMILSPKYNFSSKCHV
jgi:hypothetical protein